MTDTGTITRTPGTETAVLAGGCFWGMEDLIRRQPGVLDTRVGYTGGSNDHATYRNHPGHAEAVEIVFDPTKTTYRDILAFFFQIHDPSTKDRQGNDRGASYRSAIYYTSPAQQQEALDTIADVDAFKAAVIADSVDAALAAHAVEPPASALLAQRDWIDECYAGDTVADIVAALRGHDAGPANDAADLIASL